MTFGVNDAVETLLGPVPEEFRGDIAVTSRTTQPGNTIHVPGIARDVIQNVQGTCHSIPCFHTAKMATGQFDSLFYVSSA